MKTHFHIAIATLLLTSLQSYSESRQDDRLREQMPESWVEDAHFSASLPGSGKWWTDFGDTTLDSLVNIAIANNPDALVAARRIEISCLGMKQALSAAWPTLSASAGWRMSQPSGATSTPPVATTSSSAFSAGLDMSWEVDVFGRIAAQRKLAKARTEVSRADYDAVISSLVANVVKSYVTLRLYQAQMNVAREHMESQDKVMHIAEARFDCGLASMLDVTQSRIVLYSTRATVPALESLITNAISSLSTLCGSYPADLGIDLSVAKPLPNPFQTIVQTGVPADLLRRRPDVVEAEKQLAVYAAQIGIAKKDFLPALSIAGSIGTSAHRLDGLFGKHSMSWSVAPQLSWTVFNGLSRSYAVAEAKLNMEQGIDNYNLTVMNAWQETQAAMNNYSAALQTMQMDKEIVAQSQKELELSLDLYKRGLSAFTNVVNAQMDWLSYQNSYISEHASALKTLISVYQSLGGAF